MIPIDIFDLKGEYLAHIDLDFIPPFGTKLAFKTKKEGYAYSGKITEIEVDVDGSGRVLVEITVNGGLEF